MKKEEIAKLKKEIEEKYLEITKQIGTHQQNLNNLSTEKVRLEGEFRLLEKLEKDKQTKTK